MVLAIKMPYWVIRDKEFKKFFGEMSDQMYKTLCDGDMLSECSLKDCFKMLEDKTRKSGCEDGNKN